MIRKQEITVTEKALEPVVPMGATVVCADGISPESGDFIVYFPFSGLPLFRKWRPLGNGDVLLESLNREMDSYRASETELRARGKILVILSMNRVFRILQADRDDSSGVRISSPDDFLTFQEAMAILKVKRTRMYTLLQTGAVRASKLGRLWRIERSSLNEFIRNCRAESPRRKK